MCFATGGLGIYFIKMQNTQHGAPSSPNHIEFKYYEREPSHSEMYPPLIAANPLTQIIPMHLNVKFSLARILVPGDVIYSLYSGRYEMVKEISSQHVRLENKNYLHHGALVPEGSCLLFPDERTLGWERFIGGLRKVPVPYTHPEFDLTKVLQVGCSVNSLKTLELEAVVRIGINLIQTTESVYDRRGHEHGTGKKVLLPPHAANWIDYIPDFRETEVEMATTIVPASFSLEGMIKKGDKVYCLLTARDEKIIRTSATGFETASAAFFWNGTINSDSEDCLVFPSKYNRNWSAWSATKTHFE